MGSAVKLREDHSAVELRRLARVAKDVHKSSRLLSIAAVLEGMSRADAARNPTRQCPARKRQCRQGPTPCRRVLLIRRNIADGDLAFFSTWCPAGTCVETLVKVEGHRRAIEDSFETAKNELGLDHNETRSWNGWHRHVSLVMLAFAMLVTFRHRANAASPPKTVPRRTTRKLRR